MTEAEPHAIANEVHKPMTTPKRFGQGGWRLPGR